MNDNFIKSLKKMCHDANSSIAILSIALESSAKIISNIEQDKENIDRIYVDKTLNVINGSLKELEKVENLVKGVSNYLLEKNQC